MAINLDNAVSSRTMDKINKHDNKPDTEAGFEDGLDFSDLFDDFDDVDSPSGFGSNGSSGGSNGLDSFGAADGGFGSSSGNGGFGSNNGFGNSSGFGGGFGGNNGFGGGFGDAGFGGLGQLSIPGAGMGQPQQQQPPKKDIFDTAVEFTSDALKASGGMLKDLMASIKTKNFDDFGSITTSWLIGGLIMAGVGAVLLIIKAASKITGFGVVGSSVTVAGLISACIGLMGVGISTLGILTKGAPDKPLSSMKDIPITVGDTTISDDSFDSTYEDLLNDYMDEEDDDDFFSDDSSSSGPSENDDFSSLFSEKTEEPKEYASNEDRLAALSGSTPRIDRRYLVENIGPFFPTNATSFSDIKTLQSGSDEYNTIRALILQALADASKTDLEELDTEIISITSSMFCYVVVCERVKGCKNTDDIAREVESYFRENSDDVSVSASVTIEHGNYKIVITKGATDIVTIGDCLQIPKVKEFFLSEKNKLPFVAGIDQFGAPVLADAKEYATMLVAGKPRSGKSWSVNSILIPQFAFNSPEDVVAVVIDPKKSNLFKTMACLPHVIGLHDDSNIIPIFNEIIYKEGERRKQILADYRCDNIWDLKKKGIKMPVLTIVIDEFMTMKANLEQSGLYKEFDDLFNMLITQLPFVGIYLMFVPHRSSGVVNKTARQMIMFSEAVRADNETVKETLDVKKWDIALTKPGDTALRMADTGVVKYVRAAAIATSDGDNMTLIEDIAKAWYRMGADIPKFPELRLSYNRNEKQIAEMLGLNTSDVSHVHYDGTTIVGGRDSDTLSAGSYSRANVDYGWSSGVNIDDLDQDGADWMQNVSARELWSKEDGTGIEVPKRGVRKVEPEAEDIDYDWMRQVDEDAAKDDDGWQEGISASKLWDDDK